MVRKLLLILGLVAILFPLGCSTPRPYFWGWSYNKRRINTMLNGFEEAASDFNRLVLQDVRTFPDKMLQAQIDFDRIVFEMDERTLEDL